MYSWLFVVAVMASRALAAPTQPPPWSPDLAEFYSSVSKEIDLTRRTGSIPCNTQCDLSKAVMPSNSLPPPTPGQKLLHVGIGRGTQV